MSDEKTEAGVSFAELDLAPDVLHAVRDAGYTHPTPIQQQAIPLALAGRDLIGLAQTGTGKTAAFSLPMLRHRCHCRPSPIPPSMVMRCRAAICRSRKNRRLR